MARRTRQPGYYARLANAPEDFAACLVLRNGVFRAETATSDQDTFDETYEHVLIRRRKDDALVACFRFVFMSSGSAISDSYSAQFYDLSGLAAYDRPMMEMGRFCVDPTLRDPDIIRVAWGAMAEIVQSRKAELLFGCSSFAGTDERPYYDAFAVLRDRYIAPSHWRPHMKAPSVFEFARRLRRKADPKVAMRVMPPLLKTYLAMGGWVSDHAVVDRDLDTLHVFTGVAVSDIPPARQRSILSAT